MKLIICSSASQEEKKEGGEEAEDIVRLSQVRCRCLAMLLWPLFRARSAAEQPSFSTSVDEKDRVAYCARPSHENLKCATWLKATFACIERASVTTVRNTGLSYLAKIAGLPSIEVHGKRVVSEKPSQHVPIAVCFQKQAVRCFSSPIINRLSLPKKMLKDC